MQIGKLAKSSGVSSKLIRHYESIGLVPKASRSEGGYRQYSENDIQFLRFIKRGRSLGFSIKEIKKLVSLWRNKSRNSREVKALAAIHVESLEEKIAEMKEIVENLKQLSKKCHGDSRPDCPILEGLEK